MTTGNGPGWAGAALAAIAPQRIDDLGDVSEVRLVSDHDDPGGLYVLVMAGGELPMLSWRVPAQFAGEVLGRPGSNAIIRCRPGRRLPSLVTPPGELPSFMSQPAPAAAEPGPGEIEDCG